ncbi:HAMP domain-containing protein [Candidatus Magnetomoraceae bacterium gMMP-13]
MIIYFLLIGFASVLVGVEFIIDTHGIELEEGFVVNLEKYMQNEISKDEVLKPIDKLRNKAILMVGIIMFVMLIVLTMFIKNITEPLQHMIEVSKKISKGDLSQTIKIHSNNELAELGNVINEMSSNLQEMILFSKNMCSSGNEFVEKTSSALNGNDISCTNISEVGEEIKRLNNEFELLNEFIECFDFYSVDKEEENHV